MIAVKQINKEIIFKFLFVIAVLFAGLYIHAGGMIGFKLERLPGDLVDSRFNNYILEHGFRFFTGQEHSFWSAPYMYPFKNVVALSDNLLGTLPFYMVFRLFGCDRETAYQCWILLLMSLNFLVCVYVFNKLFSNIFAAVAGAFIFAFSIALFTQSNHVQVLPRFIIPVAFYAAILFFRTYKLKYFLISLLCLVYQYYCGIYLGFFLFLGMLFFYFAGFVSDVKNHFGNFKKINYLLKFFLIVIIAIALLYPLMAPYYQISKSGLIKSPKFMPYLVSYIYAYNGGFAWKFLEHTGDNLSGFYNHKLFAGIVPLCCFFISVFFWKKYPREIKIAMVSLILLILFTLKINHFTLYRFIVHIPGFSSLEDICRVINIELFFFGLIVAKLFSMLSQNRKPGTIILYILIFTALLCDQYIDTKNEGSYAKLDGQKRVTEVENKLNKAELKYYRTFAYCPNNNDNNDVNNIDAMLASQLVNKPTVNGYSSTCPTYICEFLRTLKSPELAWWISKSKQDKEKVLVIN